VSALAPADQRRLEHLVLLAASSQFDNESLVALRAAARISTSAGLTLLEALRASTTTQLDLRRVTALEEGAYKRGYQAGPADGAKRNAPASWAAFADHVLHVYPRLLSALEQKFCSDYCSKGWRRPTSKLSESQASTRDRIAALVPVRERCRAVSSSPPTGPRRPAMSLGQSNGRPQIIARTVT
jgi:hypothetical protein